MDRFETWTPNEHDEQLEVLHFDLLPCLERSPQLIEDAFPKKACFSSSGSISALTSFPSDRTLSAENASRPATSPAVRRGQWHRLGAPA